ncbi:hypothetical protein Tco_1546362 [Tanacetum coccineum]
MERTHDQQSYLKKYDNGKRLIPHHKNVTPFLHQREEKKSKRNDVMTGDDIEKPTKIEMEMPVKETEKEDEAKSS